MPFQHQTRREPGDGDQVGIRGQLQHGVARGQQPWPPHITTYSDWSDRYTAMATSLGMPITDLNEAVEVTHALIHAIDIS